MGQLREAHKSEDLEAIDKYSAELQQLFAQATQNAQNQAGGANSNPEANFTEPENKDAGNNKSDDSDVSDIDYEEVD